MSKQHPSLLDLIPGLNPPVVFEPVPDEDDELIQSINNDPVTNDDNWQLDEVPDEEKLEKFWDDVIAEVGAEKPEEPGKDAALY